MNLKILKKSIFIVLSLALVLQVYFWAEPTGAVLTAADQVKVTLVVDAGLTITDGLDVIMDPHLGISSDTAIGSSSWTVKSNSVDGYTLAVKASSSPALVHINRPAEHFDDYSEATSGVPDLWSVDANKIEFGYSVFGTDVNGTTWGTGNTCGSAPTIPVVDRKYIGLETTDRTIATRSTVTPNSGIVTNICFAAEQKGVYAPSGTYEATITATATTI